MTPMTREEAIKRLEWLRGKGTWFDSSLSDALDLAIAALGGGWRPIEEAPRDGTLVKFHVPGNSTLLWGRADDYWYGLDSLKTATHFYPLPAPPKGESHE